MVFDQPLRPTQPSTLSGVENEYRPNCGDDLWMASKGGYGSFQLWIDVWVAGKLYGPSLTRATPECLRVELVMIKCYTNRRFTLLYLSGPPRAFNPIYVSVCASGQ